VVSQGRLRADWRQHIPASHLSCTRQPKIQYQTAVKLHRVFPSSCCYPASSQGVQFHRAPPRDRVPVVTPFMQATTYVARNFATLGPFYLTTLCYHRDWTISSPHRKAALPHSGLILCSTQRMASEELLPFKPPYNLLI